MNTYVREPSPLAYEALERFEDIMADNPVRRPHEIHNWAGPHAYRIEDMYVALHGAESLLLHRQANREFDPSTSDMIWRGSGIVTNQPVEAVSPIPAKEAFVLGRRFDRGNPRHAKVLPAIVTVSSRILRGTMDTTYRFPERFSHEDIAADEEKLSKLVGWLR